MFVADVYQIDRAGWIRIGPFPPRIKLCTYTKLFSFGILKTNKT